MKEAFSDPMVRVLLVAAALSIGVGAVEGHLLDGIAISVAVIIVTSVGTFNQLRAQRDYTALEEISSRELTRVIRDGKVAEIDSEELVTGDVVEVHVGDITPADMVFVGRSDLLVSEAQITGEPETTKADGDELFAGSRVLDGSGRGIVAAVGDETVFGRIRQELAREERSTPLEERLERFAKQIGIVGSAVAVITFIALIVSGLLRDEVGRIGSVQSVEYLLETLTIAITIVVVTVPEGLPLAVTLCLAYTTRRMAEEKALVRELSACETMGAATIVCSDKTGTLTEGRMSLLSLVIDGREVPAAEVPTSPAWDVWCRSIATNSTADLVYEDDGVVAVGNSTEGAMLVHLEAHGVDYLGLRIDHELLERIEFNSDRKYMESHVPFEGRVEAHVKGAPEVVIGRCEHELTPEGRVPLDDDRRRRALEAVRTAARRGHRTLAVAVGDASDDGVATELSLVAVAVLSDPLRPTVVESVERCKGAGVGVMMITGDVSDTARQIARESGIAEGEDDRVIAGDELAAMTDEELTEALPTLKVVARALPDDKSRIARLLQEQGHVVAMTGDGVNDAPALVTADVGFSMGSGSRVAREASDIVVVDDDFTTIVRAIRWGRSVFENIRKFLQFQLTVNVVALAVAFSAAMLGFGTPLTAVQLLWVNLIMDSFAALALTLERPSDALYQQPPHARTEPLVSRFMWMNVIGMGVWMTIVIWIILATDLLASGPRDDVVRTTLVFNTFVLLQVANLVNARAARPGRNPLDGLLGARWFLAIGGFILLSQVFIVQVGGSVFRTTALDLEQWVVCAAIGLTAVPVGIVLRWAGGRVDRARATKEPGTHGDAAARPIEAVVVERSDRQEQV